MKRSLLLLFALVTVSAASAQRTMTTADIAAVFNSGDGERIAALFTRDGQLYGDGQPVASGRAALRDYYGLPTDPARVEAARRANSVVEIPAETEVVNGRGMRVSHGTYTLTATRADGSRTPVAYRYVAVWKPEGGLWRMHRLYGFSTTAPAASN